MTFLNPAVLWGLLAIGIPILIHLFNFRRPRRVLFSNIAFVREVNEAVVHRMRLKQWLLLLARILGIAGLVLAFANPVILPEGTDATALEGNRSVVVVVDNSLSMSASDGNGVWLQQAKLLAREVLKGYGPSDEFQVQPTGSFHLNDRFQLQDEALEQVNEIDYHNNNFHFGELVRNLELLFTEARNSGRVVYFLSDFQTTTVLKDSLAQGDRPEGMRLHFIPIGSRTPPNAYVSGTGFKNAIIQQGKPLTMELALNNDGEEVLDDLRLRVQVAGEEVSIGSEEALRPGQRKLTEVTFTPKHGGWNAGKVLLDDPQVDFDNTRYFSFYIPQDQEILLVDGAARTEYLNLVFDSLLTNFRLKRIDAQQLANERLGRYSMIVLGGAQDVSSGMRDKLGEWVRGGGGLVFFPGSDMNVQAVNKLYRRMGLGQFQEPMVTEDPPIQLAEPDLSHLLFEGVFEETDQQSEFDSPSISQLYRFQPSTTGGQIQQTLLEDQNGRAILHDGRVGEGRVLSFALAPDLDWSDWPLKSSFVPILYRATLILNNVANQDLSQTIGSPELYKLKDAGEGRVKLVDAQGNTFYPEQYNRAGQLVLKFDQMGLQPGTYTLRQQDSVLGKLAFNLPDEESILNVHTPEELSAALAERGLTQVTTTPARPEVLRAEVQASEMGIPLWKYFLVAAALMFIAEVAIVKLLR